MAHRRAEGVVGSLGTGSGTGWNRVEPGGRWNRVEPGGTGWTALRWKRGNRGEPRRFRHPA
eukprot:6579002-Prymnesium_polylepis.1